MSGRRRRPRPRPSSLAWSNSPSANPPPEDDNWYAIREIIDERRRTPTRLEYLVDWEGTDRETGEAYDPSWISASQVTAAAIAEWQSGAPTTAARATRLQGFSSRPQTPRRDIPEPTTESPSSPSANNSSQALPRAVSLQLEERAPKRRRLTRAVSLSSSPATDSLDRPDPPQSSQAWDTPVSRYRRGNIVVELARDPVLDTSDYLSVQLSQTSAEGAAQSSPYTRPPHSSSQHCHSPSHSSHRTVSQRTIPDSQESLSHDSPNDSRLAPTSVHAILGLPQSVSTVGSWPSITSGEQGGLQVAASQEPEEVQQDSLPDLLRQPSGEDHELERTAFSGPDEPSEPSIPSRQPDSFPIPHSSQAIASHSSLGAEHNSSQPNTQLLPPITLSRTSHSSCSGPQFLTQLPFTSPSQPTSSTAGLTDSGDKYSAVPDSLDNDHTIERTQEQQSDNSRAADYGSAQPRGSLHYATQVVPNLLHSSQQLTGPESSSTRDFIVPETALRRPPQRLNLSWARSSLGSRSQQSGNHSRPRSPVSGAELVDERDDQQNRQPSVSPPVMEDDKQPQRSRFTDELLKIQQDFMADTQEPALLGSPEFDNEPRRGEPSPLRTLHDPVMLSFEVGDAQPDMMGSSLAPSDILQTAEEASGPTPRILLPQGHFPMDDSATSPAEGTVPAAVSPGDIRSQEVESLTVVPSDITTSAEIPEAGSRHLPDRSTLFSERQYASLDNPADMTISEDENEASDTQHGLPDNEPKEFTVTLPFPANQRPFYDAMIMNSRADIESFCSVFSNEVLRTPKPSAVHKIEALFLKLLDVCDYPPELDAASWDAMSPKEVQKYLYESNAKYALIWDMLDLLRELPMKVLIVARSERLLRFLEALVVAEGYSFSRTGLQDMEFRHATSPIKIVLVLPDQALLDDPSDFELVFGFDFEFKRSVAAKRLALLTPAQKHPMVLSLVLTHSLEHLDLGITDKDPDIPELDRKNALVIALTKIRGMVVNPEMGRTVPPHKIAQHFANLLGGPADPFPFEPIELPDSILDVYLDATQPQERGFADEEEDINSKKRKLDDFEEVEAKRQKLSALVPIVDINRVEALSPLIRCLGVEVLDEEDTSDEVTVPRALLKVMESKVNDQQKALEESRYREEELKRLVANLSRRNDEFSNTINTIHAHHRAAIEERSKFERERDSSEQKAKSLEARLQAAEEEKAKLVAELVEIKAAPAPAVREPGQGPTAAASEPAAASDLEKALEASEADIERYKKRYENSERDHDYTRQAYQNASRSAEELANENRELAAQVKDLTHKASENLRAIHETNVKSQVSALGRVNDELAVTLKEREWELDRLREELKVYKARRETRQSSVPRSPRMGVMSPRTGRAVQGGASRGSSPVQLETPQNHRWQHLRE